MTTEPQQELPGLHFYHLELSPVIKPSGSSLVHPPVVAWNLHQDRQTSKFLFQNDPQALTSISNVAASRGVNSLGWRISSGSGKNQGKILN